jgi:endonuclease IV
MAKVGSHVGFMGTLTKTYKHVEALGLTASQVYLPQYAVPYPDIIESRKCCLNAYKCFHSCLAANLAGSTDGTLDPKYKYKLQTARSKLLHEVDIAAISGADVVVHCGTCKDHFQGLLTVIDSLKHVLTTSTDTCEYFAAGYDVMSMRSVALENAAGEANKLGSSFDEIKFIIGNLPEDLKKDVGICIDTAHIMGSGLYDMGKLNHVHQFFQDVGNTFGMQKLRVIHMNDSEVPFGSHKDRHAALTRGFIFGKDGGEQALSEFVKICSSLSIPLVSETSDPYSDINLIRELLQK